MPNQARWAALIRARQERTIDLDAMVSGGERSVFRPRPAGASDVKCREPALEEGCLDWVIRITGSCWNCISGRSMVVMPPSGALIVRSSQPRTFSIATDLVHTIPGVTRSVRGDQLRDRYRHEPLPTEGPCVSIAVLGKHVSTNDEAPASSARPACARRNWSQTTLIQCAWAASAKNVSYFGRLNS